MNRPKLSEMEQKLLTAFMRGDQSPRDHDVSIDKLHGYMYGDTEHEPRRKQQRVGVHIARLNKKLGPDLKIRPGDLKRTYRMVSTKDK